SFLRLYSIQVSMKSLVNTSPFSRKSWSFSRLSRAMSSEPGSCLICLASSGGSSYRSLSIGLPGSILLATPSSPAIPPAAAGRYGLRGGAGVKDRYGLQVGSGVRNSMRLDFSELKYIGMRIAAERLRAL